MTGEKLKCELCGRDDRAAGPWVVMGRKLKVLCMPCALSDPDVPKHVEKVAQDIERIRKDDS